MEDASNLTLSTTHTTNISVNALPTKSPEIESMGNIAYGIIAPVIISFGIISNLLNLIVLTRPSLRSPTFRYLKWLAVDNLLVCMFLLPFTLHQHSKPVSYAAAFYFAHIEVPAGNALIATSAYIVVGLSIDRYVAVCHPRRYKTLHCHYVASVRIALSFIVAFSIYIPMAFYKKISPVIHDKNMFIPVVNEQLTSTTWFTTYEILLEICARFAPAILLAFLNIWIIIEFKKISKKRRNLYSGQVNPELSYIPSQSYPEVSNTNNNGDENPSVNQNADYKQKDITCQTETNGTTNNYTNNIKDNLSRGSSKDSNGFLIRFKNNLPGIFKTPAKGSSDSETNIDKGNVNEGCLALSGNDNIATNGALKCSSQNLPVGECYENKISSTNALNNNPVKLLYNIHSSIFRNTQNKVKKFGNSNFDSKHSRTNCMKTSFSTSFIELHQNYSYLRSDDSCSFVNTELASTKALSYECINKITEMTLDNITKPRESSCTDVNNVNTDKTCKVVEFDCEGERNIIKDDYSTFIGEGSHGHNQYTDVYTKGKGISTGTRNMLVRRHDMERRLVLLLISIIVAFYITNIPTAILSLTYSKDLEKSLSFQIFRAIANNLEFLNFGINFILYFLFSKDIRKAFMDYLRKTVNRFQEYIDGTSSSRYNN